jgi:hypothetical protein
MEMAPMADPRNVDTVMHFTDEIGTVEISTFRDKLHLRIPHDYKIVEIIEDGPTFLTIAKRDGDGTNG